MSAVLDLDDVALIVRPGSLPPELLAAVVTTNLPVQTATCPYCGGPVPSLLAGCPERACWVRELDADRAYARELDQ